MGMTKRAIATVALKALLTACATVIAVGFAFRAIDSVLVWAVIDSCRAHWWRACDVSEFWTAWWWVVFIIVAWPLWLLALVVGIRRFASAGYRLAAFGFVCAFVATLQLVLLAVGAAVG